MSRSGEHTAWLDSLSPWPAEGFGLERMHALLAAIGSPHEAFEAVHVVGTNGKSTATRTVEALLLAEGLTVGATVSPHVRSWSERITLDGREADLEEALGRVRAAAERLHATQFETITAAALAAFAAHGVDAAVVEAGLGGRLDATNVLRTRVVLLTNVGLDHTDVLGETRAEIAAEKLAVVRPGAVVVLPDREYASLVAGNEVVVGGAREAASAFVGRPVTAEVDVSLPGRLERRPGEVRDGAHNADGAAWLVAQLEPARFVVCASVLRDKDASAMLAVLSGLGDTFVATRSTSPRALPAAELARLARPFFARVEAVDDPVDALRRAHELGGEVLVTGSLYLLADLAAHEAGARA